MPTARNQSAGAETDTELVATPGVGKQIRVYSVVAFSDTAQTILFESDAITVWEQYAAASGGHVAPSGVKPYFVCADNDALTYTTTAVAETFVSVVYEISDSTAP